MLTQYEVAAIMTARGFPMTRARVHQIEKRALLKLRSDPLLQKMAEDAGCERFCEVAADRLSQGVLFGMEEVA